MIESFFGFTGTPFGRNMPPSELMENDAWNEMAGRLQHVVRIRGFGVFTGDTGTGKTTALRRFAHHLDPNRHRILYVCDSSLTPRNFYWETLHQLGREPRFNRGDAKRQLQKALSELVEERKTPVVIVDEAHLLSSPDFACGATLFWILTERRDLRSPLRCTAPTRIPGLA